MLRIFTARFSSVSLILACLYSLPATAQNSLSGFFVEGGLGAGVLVAEDQQTLNSLQDNGMGTLTPHEQSNNSVSFAGGLIYGLTAGYDLALGTNSALEPSVTYNRVSGSAVSTWSPSRNVTGGTNGPEMSISPKTRIKQQLNFFMSFKRLVSKNLALGVGIGASQLKANTGINYELVDNGMDPTTAFVGTDFNDKNRYLWGPAFNFAVQWLLNKKNSLLFTFSDEFYPNTKLPTADNPFTAPQFTTKSLKRNVVLNIAAFVVQYRYTF